MPLLQLGQLPLLLSEGELRLLGLCLQRRGLLEEAHHVPLHGREGRLEVLHHRLRLRLVRLHPKVSHVLLVDLGAARSAAGFDEGRRARDGALFLLGAGVATIVVGLGTRVGGATRGATSVGRVAVAFGRVLVPRDRLIELCRLRLAKASLGREGVAIFRVLRLEQCELHLFGRELLTARAAAAAAARARAGARRLGRSRFLGAGRLTLALAARGPLAALLRRLFDRVGGRRSLGGGGGGGGGGRARRGALGAWLIEERLELVHALEEVGGEATRLDDHVVEQPLLVRLAQDVLLDGRFGDEPVDVHLARLADAVRAVLRLRIDGRVPVGVVEDHGVGARQVDAQPARARREDEDEDLGVQVEPIHELLPLVHLGRAVQSQVRVAADVDPALEHVEHLGHLREDEAAVPTRVQLAQQRAEHLELAAVPLDETLVGEGEARAHTQRLQLRESRLGRRAHERQPARRERRLARVVTRRQARGRRAGPADLRRERLEERAHRL